MKWVKYLLFFILSFFAMQAAYCACADLDGDGVAETCVGGDSSVPAVSDPTPAYDSSSSSSSSSAATTATAARTVAHAAAPSTEAMMRTAVTSAVVGSLFEAIMSTPSGPTPEEIEAQRRAEEQARIIAEQKRQAFLRNNSELSGKLKKGNRTTYEQDNNITTTGGLQLKKLGSSTVAVSSDAASSGDVHRNFFGSGPTTKPTLEMKPESPVINPSGMLSNHDYARLISTPNLTQEERERLYLRTVSRPHDPRDWMVDQEALVEAEHYSDPYLDVAKAAAKGAGKVLLTAGRDEVAKKIGGENLPYDEMMSLPDAKKYKEKNNAEKTIQLIDYGLTKAPTWTTFVDAGVNGVAAGTREAIIIYRASKDKQHRAPKKFAKEEWDKDHKCMGDWGKAVTDRIGAGEFGEE